MGVSEVRGPTKNGLRFFCWFLFNPTTKRGAAKRNKQTVTDQPSSHRCPFWLFCSKKKMAIPGLPDIHQGKPICLPQKIHHGHLFAPKGHLCFKPTAERSGLGRGWGGVQSNEAARGAQTRVASRLGCVSFCFLL